MLLLRAGLGGGGFESCLSWSGSESGRSQMGVPEQWQNATCQTSGISTIDIPESWKHQNESSRVITMGMEVVKVATKLRHASGTDLSLLGRT